MSTILSRIAVNVKFRRFTAFCCSVYLVFSCMIPTFANSLNSNLATPGNAIMSPGIQSAIEGIEPYAEDPGSIGGSTVSKLSLVGVVLRYTNTSGRLTDTSLVHLSSSGKFIISKPSDFGKSHSIIFIVSKSLPSSGKYKITAGFSSDTGGFTYGSPSLYTVRKYQNASDVSSSVPLSILQGSGNFTIEGNVDFGLSLFYASLSVPVTGLIPPFGGVFSLRYEKLPVNAEVSGSTAGGATTPQEQVVDKVDSIGAQLSEGFDGIIGAVTGVGDKISGAMGQASDEINANADKNSQNQINAMEENTNIITSALSSLGHFIIDGLKGLFIPSDDFFKSYFDDLYAWFEERLGFLMFPIDLIIQLADVFLGSSDVDCILTLPSFSISGEQLWAEQSFNFTAFLEEHFAFLLTAIRMVSSIGLVIMFVQLCERKWEEVMQN